MGVLSGLVDRAATRFANYITTKSTTGGWTKLWEMAQEQRLMQGEVTQPYKQTSNVYKAIKAIADNVPQADMAFYQYSDDKRIYPDELLRLFDKPNPLMSGSDFVQAVVGFFALFGEAFIIKQTSVGQVIGTRRLPAELWTFKPTEFLEVVHHKQLVGWRQGTTVHDLNSVIHFRDFNPYSNLRGLAPPEVIKKTIDIDWQSLVYNKAFFDNFAQLGTVWSTEQTLTEDQVKRIIEWQEKRHGGASKAFKVAVAHRGLKPLKSSVSPRDMDFVEQKRLNREEIIGIWRVPKAMFSMTEDLNYATFTGQMKIFWLYTIEPILRKLEDAFNRGLVAPYDKRIYCRFDTSNVAAFTEDLKDKIATAKTLFEMGFTANEINDKLELGFEPKPWRDQWWVPFTLAPAGEAAPPPAQGEGKQYDITVVTEPSVVRELPTSSVSFKFVKIHGKLEQSFVSSLRRFFFEQRKRVLSSIMTIGKLSLDDYEAKLKGNIDWEFEDSELIKRTQKHIKGGLDAGQDWAKALVPQAVIDEGAMQLRLRSVLRGRLLNVTRINTTTRKNLRRTIQAGLEAGEAIPELADRVRNVYNVSSQRAVMIARTEMTGAMNDSATEYYKAAGVGKKKWLSAADERVRPSHEALNGEVVTIDSAFSNGLDYPGASGPAEEVINCRCTCSPVIETEGEQ